MEFFLLFDEIVMDVQPFIQCAYFAMKQINTSKKFKAILRMMLQVGNYMNGGTQRGGAYGFTFQSIEKFKDTKSSDNKHNLLHYLFLQIEMEGNKYLQKWYEELPQVALATKVSMDLIRPRLGHLAKGTRDLGIVLKDYHLVNQNDQFQAIFHPFLDTCIERTKFVEKDFERLEREYREFLNLWLLDEQSMPMETAFILTDNLINDYLRAETEILAEREARERKRRMEEKKLLSNLEKTEKLNTQSNLTTTAVTGGSPPSATKTITPKATCTTLPNIEEISHVREQAVQLPDSVRDVTATVREGKANFRAYRASQMITTPIVFEENSDEDDQLV
eukprot:TRINITY_DN5111_c0_g5_i4.p1 TRINITY_DN5111_c0_g5~~TRINITY_DN5111_c0_g5_i4.p1  ORF type:complete len:334 (-),score=88.40 TRINITY_DN5111_c0_g5_i4:158-1159(-)